LSRAVAAAATVAATAGTIAGSSEVAEAHDLTQYYRFFQCNNAGKYGCQTYYVVVVNSQFGPYYDTKHLHGCTERGGDSQWWRLELQNIKFSNNPLQLSYSYGDPSGTQRTSGWCAGAYMPGEGGRSDTPGQGEQWWAYVGNNGFKVQTQQKFPIGPVYQRCFNEMRNVSGLSVYEGNAASCQTSTSEF